MWRPALPPARRDLPRYKAIAAAIEADVLSGQLRPGDRLPPLRELAQHLGVTVGTVARGYAEARNAGWITGQVGRGTFVLDRASGRFQSTTDSREELIDLSLNIPLAQPAPDLAAALRALTRDGAAQTLLGYAPRDDASEQAAGAAVLEQHGLSVEPARVVSCAGAQHGIGAVLEAICRAGDDVLVEELTYPPFIAIARARGLRIHPVALDEDGIVPRSLEKLCRTTRPKALYTIPTLHNPTTAILPGDRREAVAALARRHDVTIIEDDVYRMLAPDAPAPLASFAPERTVYIASLSKSFVPSLRLAFIAAPDELRDQISEAVWRSLWTVSALTSALAAHWIRGGTFASVAAARRREAAARQELAASLLAHDHLQTAATAYHLWLDTGDKTAEAFALQARGDGVLVTPSSAFHVGTGRPPRAVRVALSAAPDHATLATALQTLQRALTRPASLSAL
jgi:DNA-binding transcriptional MocR family regulator